MPACKAAPYWSGDYPSRPSHLYLLDSPQAGLKAQLLRELAPDSRSLYALPGLLFGFLLCPYLDLSFHQVTQESPGRSGRWSFAIGFPLLFGTMLAFSLAYRDEIAAPLLGQSTSALAPYLQVVLALLILQMGFTLIIHARRLQALSLVRPPWVVVCIVLPVLVGPWLADVHLPGGIGANEVIYRIFIAFYAILAPSYMWLVAFNPRPIRPAVAVGFVLLALLLAAVPMLLSTDYLWLYGVAVALLLVARSVASFADSESTAGVLQDYRQAR